MEQRNGGTEKSEKNQQGKNESNRTRISARLDSQSADKLDEIMAARGLDRSEAIRFCINRSIILNFGNTHDLGQEFCRIRTALEQNSYDEKVERQVEELCQSIKDVLRKVENLRE